MKVYCQYSGIEFDVSGFGSTRLTYIHPIFAAEPKWLLSRMGSWSAQKLTADESKLLFLAILHSTDLVEFRATANPAPNIVALNMESLAKIYAWMLGINRVQMVMPKFVVSPENRKMENVRYWIESWWEGRKSFEDGYSKYLLDRKLADKEAALERLIRNSQRTTEDYAGLLATWAMEASNAPKGLRDYWRELFQLKGLKVYAARAVDLQEVLDHMEENLEHGSIFAASTMKHLRTLVKKNAAGLNYGLGITDEDLAEIDTNPFTIVEGSVEEHNMQVIAAGAPESEPDPKAYSSRVQYLRAKAAWQLAERAREYAREFTQQTEEAVAEDEELNELLEEDGSEDERKIDVELPKQHSDDDETGEDS